jgi:hypothetical protein
LFFLICIFFLLSFKFGFSLFCCCFIFIFFMLSCFFS